MGVYQFEDFELDDRRFVVTRRGEPVPMQKRTFDLVQYLLEHRDRVVDKIELLTHVWPGSNALVQFVPPPDPDHTGVNFQMAGDGFTVEGGWVPPPDPDHPWALGLQVKDATGAVVFDSESLGGCTATSCDLAP